MSDLEGFDIMNPHSLGHTEAHVHDFEITHDLPGVDLGGGLRAVHLRCKGCSHEVNGVLTPARTTGFPAATSGSSYDPACGTCRKAGAHLGDHAPEGETA